MLLTLTTTHNPATDLGYLLHKNPSNLHSFDLSFGKAHVFYPEATAERCTAALLLDVDPIGLVRGKRGQHEGGTLDQYVNDRPYVLSSFLSVAMGRAFGTAMSGRSKGRQELADHAIPLTAKLTVVACRDGEGLIRQLFGPLGYSVTTAHHPLYEYFPEMVEGPNYSVRAAAHGSSGRCGSIRRGEARPRPWLRRRETPASPVGREVTDRDRGYGCFVPES